MTDKELEKLIEDMAKKYAAEHQDCFFGNDYFDLKTAFIDGFKEGMKFKEKK